MSHRSEFAVVDPDESTLDLKLANPSSVQLVCVVNGLANGYSNYLNWGRVRTIQAWTDDPEEKEISVLQSNDQSSFQGFQDVQVPHGKADHVRLQIRDLYEGQQVTSVDPDVCHTRNKVGEGVANHPIGCNLNATPRAGIAEVKVYVLQHNRLRTLWPLWPFD